MGNNDDRRRMEKYNDFLFMVWSQRGNFLYMFQGYSTVQQAGKIWKMSWSWGNNMDDTHIFHYSQYALPVKNMEIWRTIPYQKKST